MQSRGRMTAYLAMSVALGMMLSYVEAMLPVFFGVPGMKPGLSNILVVFLLYTLGWKAAIAVNILRIILTGILFGNPFSIAYSLSGALVSFVIMILLRKTSRFSVYGVSMAGGVFHNVWQIIIAMILVENYRIILYLPPLLLCGCLTGFLVAFLAAAILKRIGHIFND